MCARNVTIWIAIHNLNKSVSPKNRNEIMRISLVALIAVGMAMAKSAAAQTVPATQQFCDTSDPKRGLPIQIFSLNSRDYDVKSLDINTGQYTQVLALPGRTGSDGCGSENLQINSCAISPETGALYCVYWYLYDCTQSPYLIRISGTSGTADQTCVARLEYPYS